MRSVLLLGFALTAFPATAQAGGTPTGDSAKRTTCARITADQLRQQQRAPAKLDCRPSRNVPPVVDPTPIFLL